jgi:hypothetical protein
MDYDLLFKSIHGKDEESALSMIDQNDLKVNVKTLDASGHTILYCAGIYNLMHRCICICIYSYMYIYMYMCISIKMYINVCKCMRNKQIFMYLYNVQHHRECIKYAKQ